MNSNVTRVVDEVITALSPGLRGQPCDRHTRYASTTVPGGEVSDVVDVLVQTAESRDMFALWHGDGLPTSCDEEGFAAPVTCALAPDGSIVAWLEEVRTGEDDEPYELVRVLWPSGPTGSSSPSTGTPTPGPNPPRSHGRSRRCRSSPSLPPGARPPRRADVHGLRGHATGPGRHTPSRAPLSRSADHLTSKRSASITWVQAATKSWTNFSAASSLA